MCKCPYVHMYICIRVCIYMCIYIYIYIEIYTHIHVYRTAGAAAHLHGVHVPEGDAAGGGQLEVPETKTDK